MEASELQWEAASIRYFRYRFTVNQDKTGDSDDFDVDNIDAKQTRWYPNYNGIY